MEQHPGMEEESPQRNQAALNFLKLRFKHLAKTFARPINAGLNGFHRTIEDDGDFRLRLLLPLGKNERLTQFLRQGGDGLAHNLGSFRGLETLTGRGVVSSQAVPKFRAGFLVLGVIPADKYSLVNSLAEKNSTPCSPLTRWMTMQADMQFLFNPAVNPGAGSRETATIFGLRAQITFRTANPG